MRNSIAVMAPLVLSLGACGLAPKPAAPPVAIIDPAPVTATTLPALGSGQPVAALDQTSAADKAAATAPKAGGRELGRVSVALGSPAEQGFWLTSPLVTVAGKGRVVTASGAQVAVELRPGQGGALLSLAAYRALGLALTDLPEVTVFID